MTDVIVAAFADTFGNYVTTGLPASGVRPVEKAEARALGQVIQTRVDELQDLVTVGVRRIAPVRVRLTANIDLASALIDGATLNGVTLATGDRVFAAAQTVASQNGVYPVVASGAAARATDADSAAELAYCIFLVESGTVGAGENWMLPLAAADITLGSTALNFLKASNEVSVAAEVVAGRGGLASLDARFLVVESRVRQGVNLVVGAGAGDAFTTGTGNAGFGEGALRDTEDGVDNTANGRAAGRGNVSGSYNVFSGVASGLLATAVEEGVFVGWEAGAYGVLGARLVLVGSRAASNYAGDDTVVVGAYGLNAVTGGDRITVVGNYGGQGAGNAQFGNSWFGYDAGGSVVGQVAGVNMTGLGASSYCIADHQVALGSDAVEDIRAFGTIVLRGSSTTRSFFAGNAGNRSPGNLGCIGIGESVLSASTATTNGIGIGDLALASHTGSNGPIAIGSLAMNQSLTINDTVAIGTNALRYAISGVGDTVVGYRTMEHATAARNCSTLGDSSFWRYQGTSGIAIGYVVAELTQTGDRSIFVGTAAGRYRKSGEDCIFIGAEAGSFHNAPGVNIELNLGAVTAGDRVIGVGWRSLAQTTGSDFVGLGHLTGYVVTGGSNSVFIGNNAGNHASQKVDPVNQVVIGHGAWAGNDNEVVIGNASNDNFTFGATSFSATELAALKALVA
tara:strand:- start:11963 stop:14002 length:2040 start_codon:yes stop_codon:yes gene_type:complete